MKEKIKYSIPANGAGQKIIEERNELCKQLKK